MRIELIRLPSGLPGFDEVDGGVVGRPLVGAGVRDVLGVGDGRATLLDVCNGESGTTTGCDPLVVRLTLIGSTDATVDGLGCPLAVIESGDGED